MFPDNLTRAEARHRAEVVETQSYEIEVDLSGAGLAHPERHFRSTSVVRFRARRAAQVHLDLIADQVLNADLDGTALDPETFADSRLPLALSPGEHELRVEAVCRYSRSGDGLHRFVDPVDDRIYLYTQFEPANARRMYGCFEQPDLKARFTLSVIAPNSWAVVSNAPVEHAEPVDKDLTRTRFGQTARISTYLTALVAGDYHTVTGPGAGPNGEIALSILCRQSRVPNLDADELFAMTRGGFQVFEKEFDFPYPFGKYDQVFVPEYNGGAMENVGCVTLRDEYLFRSKVTAASLNYRRDTILHELSHMWFGDLVTMRWWDDLWLKESFATWASSFAVSQRSSEPELPWAAFCSSSKTFAYRQDQLPTTHPVSADIVDLEAVEHNFDQITYAKGASVLVQLVAFVGLDAFLAGVRHYFAAHAYGNTALSDLLRSLERVSHRDLSAWSEQWLETAGVNTLRLEIGTDDADRVTSAEVVQTAPPDHPRLRHHRVALGLYGIDCGALVRTGRIEQDVVDARTPVPELLGQARPDAIVLNDGDLTYAKIRLDDKSLAAVTEHLPTIASPLTRAVLWGGLWDACRDAELPAATFVDLVLRGVARETEATAVRNLLGEGAIAAYSCTHPDRRAPVAEHWRRGLAKLLTAAAPESDLQLALVRTFASSADPGWSADLVDGWLIGHEVPEGLRMDADLRWTLVSTLARLGRADEARIAAEEDRDASITGQEQAAGARAARPTAAAKAEAWRLAVVEDTITNSEQSTICLSFWSRGQDDVLLPYVEQYFRAAEDISALRGPWAIKGSSLRRNVLRNLFPWPVDKQAFVDRLDPWLAEVDLSPSTRRIITERRDDSCRALRCQLAN